MKRPQCCCLLFLAIASVVSAADRPNIFIAISDDVSYPHASAYGCKMVTTPAFDRIAADGVLFNNAFCPAPGCSPSRAAFLTGRHIWMIEEAGTHASYFQTKYQTFPVRSVRAGGPEISSTTVEKKIRPANHTAAKVSRTFRVLKSFWRSDQRTSRSAFGLAAMMLIGVSKRVPV
jgi:hypothetical protein